MVEDARSTQSSDKPRSLTLATRALEIAKQYYPEDKLLQSHAQVVIAVVYYGQGKYSDAMALLIRLTEIYEDAPPNKWATYAYHYLGVIYDQFALYTNALESHRSQYEIAEAIDDQFAMASALRRIGVSHLRLEQYERALHYYHRAAKHYQSINSAGGLAGIYNNIASVHNAQKEYAQAIEMASKGIAGFEEDQDNRGLAFIHANIADAYFGLGQADNALHYANLSVDYAQKSQHAKFITTIMFVLGKALLQKGEIEEALDVSHEMLQRAEDAGDYLNVIEACKLLYECYEAFGDYKTALMYHKRLYKKHLSANQQAVKTRFEYLETIHQTQEARQEAKLQEKLRKQEKEQYQHLARMKEEFIASLSHDLKNPLSIALLAISGLKRVIINNEKGLVYIKRLQIAIERMQYLIVDVLDLAQLEMGYALNLEYQSLNPLIKNAVYEHQIHAETKNIKLIFQVNDLTNIQTMFDKIQLRRVLDNLLSNAIKYTARGGEVGVGLIHSEDQITLYVRDTGAGIPPDKFDHIFKHFARLETGPQADEVGTGLGLCAAKTIVEQHGGTIHVESEVGVGSTFSVFLPLVVAANTG